MLKVRGITDNCAHITGRRRRWEMCRLPGSGRGPQAAEETQPIHLYSTRMHFPTKWQELVCGHGTVQIPIAGWYFNMYHQFVAPLLSMFPLECPWPGLGYMTSLDWSFSLFLFRGQAWPLAWMGRGNVEESRREEDPGELLVMDTFQAHVNPLSRIQFLSAAPHIINMGNRNPHLGVSIASMYTSYQAQRMMKAIFAIVGNIRSIRIPSSAREKIFCTRLFRKTSANIAPSANSMGTW